MVRSISLFLLLISLNLFSQNVSGIVSDDEGNALPGTLVFNMNSEEKVYSNLNGAFTISASLNDELRFVRVGFERNSKSIALQDFGSNLHIILTRNTAEIEEVNIVRLTGDINQDSKNLTKVDQVYELQKEIGVPLPPEKPREKPADFKKDVLLTLVSLSIKPQAIYDLISGDARRIKAEYRYEDLQDNITWIRKRVADDYFLQMGIPVEKISAFVQFSMGNNPEITQAIKAGNLSKVLFTFEETLPIFLNRISNKVNP